MNKRNFTPLLTMWLCLGASGPLWGQEMEGRRHGQTSQPVRARFQTDFARRHDRGALFHADVALAFGALGGELGLGPALRLGVGWLPWEQLGGSLDGWGAFVGGQSMVALGPGLRYFFEDSAVSLGMRTGIGRLDQDGGFDTVAAGQLDASWQPYVSRDWSIGLGFEVGVVGLDVDANERAPTGWLIGLRLGVTFN